MGITTNARTTTSLLGCLWAALTACNNPVDDAPRACIPPPPEPCACPEGPPGKWFCGPGGGKDYVCACGPEAEGQPFIATEEGPGDDWPVPEACVPGDSQPCWSGSPETRGVGRCHDGTQVCEADPLGVFWGPCDGEVEPGPEIPDNGIDEDCDGADGSCADGTCAGQPCADTPWGLVPHGFSGLAFTAPHPRAAQGSCELLAELRECNNGEMSGTARYTTCKDYACPLDSPAGSAVLQYGVWHSDAPGSAAPWQRCEIDGTWTPSMPAPSPDPNAALCEWGSAWLPESTCGFYMGQPYVCEPPNWVTAADDRCPPGP